MVGRLPDKPQSKPVVTHRDIVLQQHWRAIVHRNQDVNRAIIIEITYGHTASCQAGSKCRPRGSTDVDHLIAFAVKKEQRLTIGYTRGMRFDFVIRMSVRNEQVEITIVVIIEKLNSP